MGDLPRIGPASRETAPARGPFLPAERPQASGDAGVPAPDRYRPAAGDGFARRARAEWMGEPRPTPNASAAFLAQSLAQDAPQPPAALRHHAAHRAYCGAAALRVEILGFGPPLDLRV